MCYLIVTTRLSYITKCIKESILFGLNRYVLTFRMDCTPTVLDIMDVSFLPRAGPITSKANISSCWLLGSFCAAATAHTSNLALICLGIASRLLLSIPCTFTEGIFSPYIFIGVCKRESKKCQEEIIHYKHQSARAFAAIPRENWKCSRRHQLVNPSEAAFLASFYNQIQVLHILNNAFMSCTKIYTLHMLSLPPMKQNDPHNKPLLNKTTNYHFKSSP